MFLQLVHNVALLLALTVAYDLVAGRFRADSLRGRAVSGVLFGLVGVVGMLTPVELTPGLIYDGRSIVLGVAGFVAGPVAAAIAAVLTAGFRIWVGGVGTASGLLTIVAAAAVGSLGHRLRARDRRWETDGRVLFLGFAIHVLTLSAQLTLPRALFREVVAGVAPTMLAVFPVVFSLIVTVLLTWENQRNDRARLEESERRYRSLFENSYVPMLIIDPQTARILDANRVASRFYGWSRGELCSMRVSDINTLSDSEVRAEMERARQAERTYFEFPHRTKHGEVRTVAVHSGKVIIDGSERLFSIVQDITPRKRAEARLRESLEEQDVLLREIHHRVKNNLAVITGLIRLQLHETPEEIGSLHALSKTRDRIEVMGLIHNMLYQEHDLSRVDIGSVLGRLATQLQDRYDASRSVRVSLDLGEVPLEIGSALPLGLIANEAITNALTHAFPDAEGDGMEHELSITLTADNTPGSAPPHKGALRIEDNGRGLPAGFDVATQESLGFRMMLLLSQQMQADLRVGAGEAPETADGGGAVNRGTVVEVTFPL
ncbi:MAG: sensor histidine kinase [Spirochaetaceae bacterium]